jgi:hypothetical protein
VACCSESGDGIRARDNGRGGRLLPGSRLPGRAALLLRLLEERKAEGPQPGVDMGRLRRQPRVRIQVSSSRGARGGWPTGWTTRSARPRGAGPSNVGHGPPTPGSPSPSSTCGSASAATRGVAASTGGA